jgi:hypothetical protein
VARYRLVSAAACVVFAAGVPVLLSLGVQRARVPADGC